MAAETAARRRLAFLFAAAHEVWAASPGLAAFYLDGFRKGVAAEKGLVVPDEGGAPRTCCPRCSALFVPRRGVDRDVSAAEEAGPGSVTDDSGKQALREGGCKVRIAANCYKRSKKKRRINVKPKVHDSEGIDAERTVVKASIPNGGPHSGATVAWSGHDHTAGVHPGKCRSDVVFVPTVTSARVAAGRQLEEAVAEGRSHLLLETTGGCWGRLTARAHKNVINYNCGLCGLVTRFQGSDSPAILRSREVQEARHSSGKIGTTQVPPAASTAISWRILESDTAEAAAKRSLTQSSAPVVGKQIPSHQKKGKQNTSASNDPPASAASALSAPSTAKKRKKTRQENSLSGMLERSKRQRANNTDGCNGRSAPDAFLSSFLSSL